MRQQRVLLWLVVFALVAAQALGLMHRVVHAGVVAGSGAGIALDSDAARPVGHRVAHGDNHDHGSVAALFTGHDDSSCRLFDPLNHEGPAALPAQLLPAELASHFIDFFQGEFLARWAALYDARGPPSLR
jgi:hypothetical protein